MSKPQFFPTLSFLLRGHFWLERQGKIGRLTPGMAVFTQRTALQHVFYAGNGNRAKRRVGLNPEQNRFAPWFTWAYTTKA